MKEQKKIGINKVLYLDENDYIKKTRSLKKYCIRSYKDLIFNILPNLKDIDGHYEKKVYTPKEFKLVYGQIKLIYSVRNNTAILENIEPSQFLLDGYFTELHTYKNMFYRNKQDRFKIDMVLKLIN